MNSFPHQIAHLPNFQKSLIFQIVYLCNQNFPNLLSFIINEDFQVSFFNLI